MACATGTMVMRLLPHFPRSISVRIPGGQGSGVVFEGIKRVFELCAEAVGAGVLPLDSLEFCLNSHTSDPTPWKIGEALSLVKYVPSSPHILWDPETDAAPSDFCSLVHTDLCGPGRTPRTIFLQRFVLSHPAMYPDGSDSRMLTQYRLCLPPPTTSSDP